MIDVRYLGNVAWSHYIRPIGVRFCKSIAELVQTRKEIHGVGVFIDSDSSIVHLSVDWCHAWQITVFDVLGLGVERDG